MVRIAANESECNLGSEALCGIGVCLIGCPLDPAVKSFAATPTQPSI